MSDAVQEDSPNEVTPEHPAIENLVGRTIDHLIRGDITGKPLDSLGRAVDQAKRGATGPLPRVT